MDLSNPKTWTDGLWGVINAPHIVVPLLVAVAIAGWWFRGSIERAKRDGFQSIIYGRDAQIAGLNMQIAVRQERLRLANDLQEYASTKFADAEKEAAKLKQQIDEKASPESIALTANDTVAMVSSASVALQSAMKAYEKADKTKLATSST
jgi:outer membrane murein-binding lipoprotein Lpp